MVETPLKTLIDRFRSRPEWQHPDAAVRVEAVLRLPSSDRELIVALAREDTDARVRRAAVKRLSEVPVLSEIAASDADPGVREEAALRLVHVALHEHDEAAARAAVAGLQDAKHLAAVAKGAPHAATREAAIRALSDPRSLAAVVRESQDTPTRLAALGRIEDAATLVALAQNLEQKAVAVAAVDRLSDPDALQAVAHKAKVGAAARRARARLETGEPAMVAAAALGAFGDDEAERRAYEEARAAHEREVAAARAREDAARAARAAELQQADERARLARAQQLVALVARVEELSRQELGAARAAFPALAAEWREASAGGDSSELQARFDAVAAALRTREEAARAELLQRERAHQDALAALAGRAEALVAKGAQAALRDADHLLREIKEALEHPGHFPSRREREALTGRLEAARRQLYPLVQQLREDAEWRRWANVSVQEELCAQVEALRAEANLERAASALHELELRWKQAKEAPKEKAEALWTRFRAARDELKARVDAFLAQEAEALAANLKKKQAFCEQAEALAESTEWVKTAAELRALQAEWKATGPVPRAVSQRVWERFRRPCDRFFTRFQEHRKQRSREWDENLARKEALCAKAEALAESTAWEQAAAELKQLQAEWRSIGAVKKSRSEAIWQRFRAACDRFFDRYKNRDVHAREAARNARETICADLEALVPAAAAKDAPEDLVTRVLAAQTAWRQAGGLPHDEMALFDERFARVRDRLVELYPRSFEGSELDPEASRRRAEKLVARVEGLVHELAPAAAGEAQTAEELAARLRDALAANTIGGREATEARWHSAAAEIESAQTAWKRLGPVPGAPGRALAERFERACQRFSELRPRPQRPRADRARPGRRPPH